MRVFRLTALGLSVGLLVYFVMPDGVLRDVVFSLVGFAAVAAGVIGVLRNIATRRWPWLLMLSGAGCWVVADVMYSIQASISGESVVFGPADVAYLAGYPLMSAGLMLVCNRLWHRHSAIVWLDSAIITVAGALLVSVLVVEPTLRDPGLVGWQRVVALSYPLADCLLLASFVRFSTVAPWRSVSRHLLLSSGVVMLAADCAFLYWANQGWDFPSRLNALFDFSYILLGLSLLHPKVTELATPDTPLNVLSGARLALLGTSIAMGPLVLASQLSLGLPVTGWAVAISSLVLCGLAAIRMNGMLQLLDKQGTELAAVARLDHLTQLPNRRTADHFIGRAMAAKSPLSVAMLDLDNFKAFNDTRGHNAGDRQLVQSAQQWSALLPKDGLLARYGGEEFLLLTTGTPEQLAGLTERLRPVTPEDQTFSAGIAAWDGQENPVALLHRADLALYRAKEQGRNRTILASDTHKEPAHAL
jgi:diguanylate cyclase (GGDEF)-like protein